jgi:hypothetical protein
MGYTFIIMTSLEAAAGRDGPPWGLSHALVVFQGQGSTKTYAVHCVGLLLGSASQYLTRRPRHKCKCNQPLEGFGD